MYTVELDSKRIQSIVMDGVEYVNLNFDPSLTSPQPQECLLFPSP
jgi:hypothetical protein